MDIQEAAIKRISPRNIEAEKSVLGSMILDKEAIAIASEVVNREDFYNGQYGFIFEALVDLYNDGKPVDVVTLQDKLNEKNAPPEIAGLEFIKDVMTSVPTSINIRQYCDIVQTKSILRKLISINEDIANKCYQGGGDIEVILEETEKRIFDLIQNRNSGVYTPINQIVFSAMNQIEKAAKNKGHVTGLATGFTDLDYMTSGLQKSDLILIAARPSMGKTALALNMLKYIAINSGKSAAMFSLEMSKEQLVNRLLSMESQVNSQNIRSGRLNEHEWGRLIMGSEVVGKSKLIIDDTPAISIMEFRSKCRKFKIEHDIQLVIIDYLQMMTGSGKTTPGTQEISEISRSLKAVARELDVPVVALSQLNRAVDSRAEHIPMLSDLRESGAIEQDADVVMFIFREDYYNKDTERRGIADVIIAKQRNGPIGKVELNWIPDYTQFANLDRRDKKKM